jgi:hypothetical protein
MVVARPKFTAPCEKIEPKPIEFHLYPDAGSHAVAGVSLPRNRGKFHGIEPPPEGTKNNYHNLRMDIHGSKGKQFAGEKLSTNFGHWGGKVKQLEVVDRMLVLQDDDSKTTLFDNEWHSENKDKPFGNH